MLEPPNKKLWYLSHVTVFQNLSTDVLKEIAELSRMRNFEKGAYIETPRKDSELVYFLKEGEVEVYESTSSGRRLTIDILKPGDIFGYGSFTGTGEVSIARQFVKANDSVTLCIMLRSDFLLLLEKRRHKETFRGLIPLK
jgi:CRP/FNR family transcriptional regulator, cyclic AMP receptor protein